jgi:cob(I)alamin adenosyltransferase
VECYGETDELNSHIGVLATLIEDPNLLSQLVDIQHRLFDIGGELSLPGVISLGDEPVTALETWLDAMNDGLTPLSNFILPGGSPAAAQAHICRTVARRAERHLCEFADQANEDAAGVNPVSIAYLNRLSDYLFVLARFLNKQSAVGDVLWKTAEELKKGA